MIIKCKRELFKWCSEGGDWRLMLRDSGGSKNFKTRCVVPEFSGSEDCSNAPFQISNVLVDSVGNKIHKSICVMQ